MSSPLEGNETMSSITHPSSEVNAQAPIDSSQLKNNSDKNKD